MADDSLVPGYRDWEDEGRLYPVLRVQHVVASLIQSTTLGHRNHESKTTCNFGVVLFSQTLYSNHLFDNGGIDIRVSYVLLKGEGNKARPPR